MLGARLSTFYKQCRLELQRRRGSWFPFPHTVNPPHIPLSMTLLNGRLMGQASNWVSQSPWDTLEMLEASEPCGGWDFHIYTHVSSSLVSEKNTVPRAWSFHLKCWKKRYFLSKAWKSWIDTTNARVFVYLSRYQGKCPRTFICQHWQSGMVLCRGQRACDWACRVNLLPLLCSKNSLYTEQSQSLCLFLSSINLVTRNTGKLEELLKINEAIAMSYHDPQAERWVIPQIPRPPAPFKMTVPITCAIS